MQQWAAAYVGTEYADDASVVADAHKCWAQAHVSRAESFIATRRTVATCTEKDAH